MFALIAFEVLSDVGADLWKDSTSVFSSKEDSADSDGAYDYVTRELSEDGDSWEETLGSGEYVVGVQIPEGIYTLEVDSGSDTFLISVIMKMESISGDNLHWKIPMRIR